MFGHMVRGWSNNQTKNRAIFGPQRSLYTSAVFLGPGLEDGAKIDQNLVSTIAFLGLGLEDGAKINKL